MIPEHTFELPDMPLVSIGSAAQLLGVSINLLRLYEAEGLILPARTSKNQRRYSREDLARVACIRHAIQHEQMTMASIKRMMALVPCWEIRKCSDRDRAVCDAYKGSMKPCWSVRRRGKACPEDACKTCRVYKVTSNCETIKAAIISSTT